MIKRRADDYSLSSQIQKYGNDAANLLIKIDINSILNTWSNFSKDYERDSYQDFVSLAEELIYMFGKDRLNCICPAIW